MSENDPIFGAMNDGKAFGQSGGSETPSESSSEPVIDPTRAFDENPFGLGEVRDEQPQQADADSDQPADTSGDHDSTNPADSPQEEIHPDWLPSSRLDDQEPESAPPMEIETGRDPAVMQRAEEMWQHDRKELSARVALNMEPDTITLGMSLQEDLREMEAAGPEAYYDRAAADLQREAQENLAQMEAAPEAVGAPEEPVEESILQQVEDPAGPGNPYSEERLRSVSQKEHKSIDEVLKETSMQLHEDIREYRTLQIQRMMRNERNTDTRRYLQSELDKLDTETGEREITFQARMYVHARVALSEDLTAPEPIWALNIYKPDVRRDVNARTKKASIDMHNLVKAKLEDVIRTARKGSVRSRAARLVLQPLHQSQNWRFFTEQIEAARSSRVDDRSAPADLVDLDDEEDEIPPAAATTTVPAATPVATPRGRGRADDRGRTPRTPRDGRGRDDIRSGGSTRGRRDDPAARYRGVSAEDLAADPRTGRRDPRGGGRDTGSLRPDRGARRDDAPRRSLREQFKDLNQTRFGKILLPRNGKEAAMMAASLSADVLPEWMSVGLSAGAVASVLAKEVTTLIEIGRELRDADEERWLFKAPVEYLKRTSGGKLFYDEESILSKEDRLKAGALGVFLGLSTAVVAKAVRFGADIPIVKRAAALAVTRYGIQILAPNVINKFASRKIGEREAFTEEEKEEFFDKALAMTGTANLLATSILLHDQLSNDAEVQTNINTVNENIDDLGRRFREFLGVAKENAVPVIESAKEGVGNAGEFIQEHMYSTPGTETADASGEVAEAIPASPAEAARIDKIELRVSEKIDITPNIDESALEDAPTTKLTTVDVKGGNYEVDENGVVWRIYSAESGSLHPDPHATVGGESWWQFQLANAHKDDPNYSVDQLIKDASEEARNYQKDILDGSIDIAAVGVEPTEGELPVTEGHRLTKSFDTDGDNKVNSAWFEDEKSHKVDSALLSNGNEWNFGDKDSAVDIVADKIVSQTQIFDPDTIREVSESIVRSENLNTIDRAEVLVETPQFMAEVYSEIANNYFVDRVAVALGWSPEFSGEILKFLNLRVLPEDLAKLESAKDINDFIEKHAVVTFEDRTYKLSDLSTDGLKQFILQAMEKINLR